MAVDGVDGSNAVFAADRIPDRVAVIDERKAEGRVWQMDTSSTVAGNEAVYSSDRVRLPDLTLCPSVAAI